MSNSDYTHKINKKFGEKDSVARCEPTILRIGLKTGDAPCCEPAILWNFRRIVIRRLIKIGEVSDYRLSLIK